MARPDPVVPQIHLNGSGASALLAATNDAREALRIAIQKFSATAPNMRDFYTYPDGTAMFERARVEHTTHARHLHEALEDLTKIAMAIIKQDDDRRNNLRR